MRSSCAGHNPVDLKKFDAVSAIGNSSLARPWAIPAMSFASKFQGLLSQPACQGKPHSSGAAACPHLAVPDSVAATPYDGAAPLKEARHGHPRRIHRHGRQHAADQVAPRLGDDRLHDPRQGRVPQPGGLGQGPRRALHHQGCRGARPASARRCHRRGHGRQYRHRPGARRQCLRLPHGHRHARDAEPGKKGHAAPLRRGFAAGSRGPARQPDALHEIFRPARRGDRRHRAQWRDLGQPVRQSRQPARPL